MCFLYGMCGGIPDQNYMACYWYGPQCLGGTGSSDCIYSGAEKGSHRALVIENGRQRPKIKRCSGGLAFCIAVPRPTLVSCFILDALTQFEWASSITHFALRACPIVVCFTRGNTIISSIKCVSCLDQSTAIYSLTTRRPWLLYVQTLVT